MLCSIKKMKTHQPKKSSSKNTFFSATAKREQRPFFSSSNKGNTPFFQKKKDGNSKDKENLKRKQEERKKYGEIDEVFISSPHWTGITSNQTVYFIKNTRKGGEFSTTGRILVKKGDENLKAILITKNESVTDQFSRTSRSLIEHPDIHQVKEEETPLKCESEYFESPESSYVEIGNPKTFTYDLKCPKGTISLELQPFTEADKFEFKDINNNDLYPPVEFSQSFIEYRKTGKTVPKKIQFDFSNLPDNKFKIIVSTNLKGYASGFETKIRIDYE